MSAKKLSRNILCSNVECGKFLSTWGIYYYGIFQVSGGGVLGVFLGAFSELFRFSIRAFP
jgi:hypothetical protein